MNTLTLADKVGWRYIGQEIVAFNCVNQEMAIWNTTASVLFEMITQGTTVTKLVNYLRTEYGISCNIARTDVKSFLAQVHALGMCRQKVADPRQVPAIDVAEDGMDVLMQVEMMAIELLIPFAVTMETTYACNEKCIHCYMGKSRPAMPLDMIKRVLLELADAGCLFLALTGGEFFLRKDALEIVRFASAHGFIIDILSNGTLIDEEMAAELSKYSVRRIQISLYGATAQTHDHITQLPGSFDKTVRAIELLIQHGIKVEVACALMGPNFEERYQTRALAEKLGAIISPSHIITARNDGSQDTYDLRLDDAQLREFLEDRELSSMYAGRPPFDEHRAYFGFSDILDAAPCYSGFNTCAVNPEGKVLPCNQLVMEVGDLNTASFADVWQNSPGLNRLRSLTLRQLHACSGCELLSECSRCPGLALLEGGDILGASPENCRVARTKHTLQTEEGR